MPVPTAMSPTTTHHNEIGRSGRFDVAIVHLSFAR